MKARTYLALVPWVGWLGVLVAVVVALLPVRERIERVHVALALLLVVLGGSASGGRAVGLTLTLLAYFAFHYFFIEQFDSLVMGNPLDAMVLVVFLVTSLVASQLVTRARAEAAAARLRTAEVERLASLGAETLAVGRAEDAVRSIREVIRTSLGVDECVIDPVAGAASPGDDPYTLRLPLSVHGTVVGTLRLVHSQPIALGAEQRRFLDALGHYAALAAERVRLIADAERAEAMRQAESLRASLLVGLSHDLRTPLTTIKALANRAASRLPEAAAIEREADRLDRLAGDLVDLSRLNAGALPVRLELNTAADLVGAAVQRADAAHASGRLRVVPFDADDDEPIAGRFDFVHALRALSNLVENAIKYSPPDSVVELAVRRANGAVAFDVSDRGPGIAPAEREQVFEPFYRAPGVPADAGGAGLGLAIARRLAREQGGDVLYAARAGGGSVFTLVLPAPDL
jgi:two-component system sensor histidine kinase KdpD